MKKSLYCAFGTVLAIGLAGSAWADDTDSVSTTGSVLILRPVTIHKDHDLDFGKIIQPATGISGTVSLSASTGNVTTDTGITAAGTPARAAYTINGEGGQVVTVTVDPTLSLSDGNSHTLSVTLTSDLGGATKTLSGTIGSAGSATFHVGGSFTVADTTTAASYTGTYNINVAYQ